MKHFSGPLLRAARIRRGIRIEQVALDVDRSVHSVIEYEKGRVRPPIDLLAKLASLLGVTVDDFLAEGEAADHVA